MKHTVAGLIHKHFSIGMAEPHLREDFRWLHFLHITEPCDFFFFPQEVQTLKTGKQIHCTVAPTFIGRNPETVQW